MSLRFESLDHLGKGAWKVAANSPFKPGEEKQATKKTSQIAALAPLTPHDILWNLVTKKWPEAVREFAGPIPDRKFRIDIAFPRLKLAIEVDGFAHHGKHLDDFKRDRERQNLLTLHGWRILRFAAGEIRKDPRECAAMIDATIIRFESDIR